MTGVKETKYTEKVKCKVRSGKEIIRNKIRNRVLPTHIWFKIPN